MVKQILFALSLCGMFVLSSCGGGGSDDEDAFSGGGVVVLSLQPSSIDVGDRTRVRIEIFSVNEDGAVVKISYPDALSFVDGTAVLDVDGDEVDVVPAVDTAGDDDNRFLVFFFAQEEFNRDADGILILELQGNDSVDGEIEVDIDVDDPAVSNSNEFSIANPQFQPEDSARIEVDK